MLTRKLLRTIWRYRAQFFSMILMIALGVSVFLGFNIEWVSLERDTGAFFEQTGFADYRIADPEGLTAGEAEAIAALDGVEAASRYLSVSADVAGTGNALALTVTEDFAVSAFTVMEGEPYDPDSADGLWLFDQYARENGVRPGDELTLTFERYSLTGTVRGLIESGEHMICVRDETQLMPDFRTYGYVYISPVLLRDTLGRALEEQYGPAGQAYLAAMYERVYPQINVRSALDKAAFEEAADRALGRTLLILSRDETISYAEAMGEVEEGKTMGSVLPVLFLAIAVLTMITTMNRISVNEKTQIGTLKALGFRDRRIAVHYTSFAAAVGLAGIALGVPGGYAVGRYIMDPNGMMGTYIVMPDWRLYMPWRCWLVLAVILLVIVLLGYRSVRRMLRGTAADALRPYLPPKMRRLALERTRLWDRLGFGTRWNLRDVLRHKSRSLMTLVGVVGSMVLLVGAIGMLDTVNAFLDVYYDKVAAYSSKISVAADTGNEAAAALAQRYGGDYSASVSVRSGETSLSLDVYQIRADTFRFLDGKNRVIPLPERGALICLRLADELDVGPGDSITVSPYGTSESYRLEIAGVNRSMSRSVSISEGYARELGLTDSRAYRIGSVYTAAEKAEITEGPVASVQSKQDIVDSFDSFLDLLYLAIGVLVTAAVALGVVVLYNLGMMSYMERWREMATLKVAGFRDGAIGRLLISQNLWLSLLGIALGLPCGAGVLYYLMAALAPEYEMRVVLGVTTYAVSVALTLGVSLLVSLMIARKNKKIDMVGALKSAE